MDGMVAFASNAETSFLSPATRARGQRSRIDRTSSYCTSPWESCDLEHRTVRERTHLGSCSRDPIGYAEGANTYSIQASLHLVDPFGYATWWHHWFPQQADFQRILASKCGYLIKDTHAFIDEFTTPIDPGSNAHGMLHGFIHNRNPGFDYNNKALMIAGLAVDCCGLLTSMQGLMALTLQFAHGYHNGPNGPLDPDPSSFLPWPNQVPYRQSQPNTDGKLIAYTRLACWNYSPSVPPRSGKTPMQITPFVNAGCSIGAKQPGGTVPAVVYGTTPGGDPIEHHVGWPSAVPMPPHVLPVEPPRAVSPPSGAGPSGPKTGRGRGRSGVRVLPPPRRARAA